VAVSRPALLDAARAWLAEDPDPETRAELAALVEAGDTAELADRFAGPLEFGTAGLRGRLGAGPNRMNRVVVMRASAGLAAYLAPRGGRCVVIGFDARHKSRQFAVDTATVLAGAGLRALVLPRPLPTPVLAFAIRHLGADAGVMVTASHNPPQDNGYKVYLGNGSQIAAPADAEISAKIAAVGPLRTVPRASVWRFLDDSVLAAYLARAASLVADGPRDIKIGYTPLHGVGRDVLLAAFERAGFPPPRVVALQGDPDPDFPTVAFPNPEEPGAMDLALGLDADLVLANDPDADRCAVAVSGRLLTGDEVGALLATHLVARGARGTFATTIVSSSLLSKIAARHGLRYAETLTGFKWLTRVEELRYGYEEALGYCVDPAAVRDKDGITATLLVAELAARCRARGRTLLDVLDDLARDHGLHATAQVSVRVGDRSVIGEVLARLRASPPASLGGRTVVHIDDLAAGSGGLPPTEGLRYRLAGDARVVVRPSGTEPKLKCYLEVVVPVRGGDVPAARARAAADLAALRADLTARLTPASEQG
jgi:phosphomannomutase